MSFDNLEELQKRQVGQFGFSGAKIDDLGATEYTLVGIAVDSSGSVSAFKSEMEDCLKEIVKSCGDSPRSDNLMLRLISFGNTASEEHGFKLLSQCNPDDYNGIIKIGGWTALNDATVDTVEAVSNYGKELQQQDFDANGIVFIITDGGENHSTTKIAQVKNAFAQAVNQEHLESLVSVLIGVNVTNPGVSAELQQFRADAGFDQYVELKDASAKTLAKLAAFISKSISSQSQALGTGAPSQSINF